MDQKQPLLFAPLQLRDLVIKNRVVISPMCQHAAEVDGWNVEDSVVLWRELARRGVDAIDCSSGGLAEETSAGRSGTVSGWPSVRQAPH